MDDVTGSQQAAAFHGLATNQAMPLSERLACALQALDWYEAARDRTQPLVEAAAAWRRTRNFEYRQGEINPHLLTAHQEDLDLAKAVDQAEAGNDG